MLTLLAFVPVVTALAPTRAGDLTITEFQADTSGSGRVPQYYGEWFEVHNNTAVTLDLLGVAFQSNSSTTTGIPGAFTVTTSVPVAPGAYAVLGVSGDTGQNGGVTVDYVYSFTSFNLSRSDDLLVMSYAGTRIDEVLWTSAWPTSPDEAHQASTNALGLEWANDLAINWCPATAYIPSSGMRGTPGAANRYCSDDPGNDSDRDGYAETEGDCDDTDATVNPSEIDDAEGEREGRDDDCDGVRDDGLIDDDSDGFTEIDGDCDDSTPLASPAGVETLDGLDNDCNGCPDDLDEDGDGWTECPQPFDVDGNGSIDAGELRVYDCDDLENAPWWPETDIPRDDADNYPGAQDVPYDGIDQDCSGQDECDYDRDGWNASLGDCGGTDCDDANPRVSPGAAEDPGNGIDDDCDGQVDVPDRDGDGFSETEGDCMDVSPTEDPERAALAATVYPGATEVCGDLVDNDCDGWFDNLPACTTPAMSATVRGGGFCGVGPAGAGWAWIGGLAALVWTGRRRVAPAHAQNGGAR